MTMTPEAKRALSQTVRALRDRLLRDLHDETERVYRLTLPLKTASLREPERECRRRLKNWLGEQVRSQAGIKASGGKGGKKATGGGRTEEDFRRDAEKQAAYTLLNQLVILRLMEEPGADDQRMRSPAVVTHGWKSAAYRDFRELAPALAHGDATEGYAFLLKLVFDDLAIELPGIFGSAGIADLVPIPAATLRHVVEELDKPALTSCWTDDMTLGWVYQYWNDPEREALDAKINDGGKIEPHEIASKTQMFTERYMVDWLLQNSLGPMWLAMCRKLGWTPDVETSGTLERLEKRRIEWRAKREAGEVSLTELMPLHDNTERRWAYYVPQPISEDAVTQAPETLRDLKLLDPAVGSGHFLLVALDMLAALYREEARHRGKASAPEWSDRAIVERILTHNLHGIDLDPRAVQIAAAALWIKAKQLAPDVHPERLNLVAAKLNLGSLSEEDVGLAELRREVERETGIPGELTYTLIRALAGADHLGSLLRIGRAVDEALRAHEDKLSRLTAQGDLFSLEQREQVSAEEARATLLGRLETFLTRHTSRDDLGLRLRGEQLAAGVRFVRMARERTYDLVIANPPYQGTSNMADAHYVEANFPLGKADLFAAFLLRGLELVRLGGVSAMLTMRNWMFIKQYEKLRSFLLAKYDLRSIGDFAIGAFAEVPNDVLTVAVSVFHKCTPSQTAIVAQQPTPFNKPAYDRQRTDRKIAATLAGDGIFKASAGNLYRIPGHPMVYWWRDDIIALATSGKLLGSLGNLPIGLQTGNNDRFLRRPWELNCDRIDINQDFGRPVNDFRPWKPYVKGAAGLRWIEPLSYIIWFPKQQHAALETLSSARYGQGAAYYYLEGVAYNTKGVEFSARALRFASVFDVEGRSLFGLPTAQALCLLNSRTAKYVVESLNPTIHFTAGDVARIPIVEVTGSEEIFSCLNAAFELHRVSSRTLGRIPHARSIALAACAGLGTASYRPA